jgi:hypothetical protein
MDMTEIQPPQILSLLPGRVRIHFADWPRWTCTEVEAHLACVDGVRAVRANALTGNVLIHFDPQRLSIDRLLRVLSALQTRFHELGPTDGKGSADPPTLSQSSESNPVLRAAVRGALGHAAVDLLFYGATASAYALGWTWVGSLGVFHLILDTVVWSAALLPLVDELPRSRGHWDMTLNECGMRT